MTRRVDVANIKRALAALGDELEQLVKRSRFWTEGTPLREMDREIDHIGKLIRAVTGLVRSRLKQSEKQTARLRKRRFQKPLRRE